MGAFYNIADVTINISDAEGFGLATLESLSCGTPIIANMTGGLQEQVIGPEGENGVAIIREFFHEYLTYRWDIFVAFLIFVSTRKKITQYKAFYVS